MKKRLMSIIVTLIMIMQCVPFVHAETWTDRVDPAIDMEIRESGSADFVNGPLEIEGKTAEVDFRATLDMESVFAKFIEWYDKAVSIIDNMAQLDDTIDKEALINQLNNLEITGEFVVKIYYPKDIEASQEFTTGGDMYGFNDGAKNAFYEKNRALDTDSDADNNILTITIGVTDANSDSDKLLAGELYANRNTYLANLTLTAENVTIPEPGEYTAKGTMTGYTETTGEVGSKTTGLRVDYTGKQAEGKENSKEPQSISATVILEKPSGGKSPSASGSGSSQSSGLLVFNIDGDTTYVDSVKKTGTIKLEELPYPEKSGYTLDAWYYDSARQNKVDKDVEVKGTVVLYGHWVSDTLDTEDHFAYVIGYPDGTVRPENNISREEVATIFYRLLREDKFIEIASDENDFYDVSSDRWSNKAISSLANGGYINGYEDGGFHPEDYITRAEFATMATRYAELTDNGDVSFSDVIGHWAEEYINKAASSGWVNGYEDGTFGPEKYITRAEVMTIINRMLVRHVDAEGLHADTKLWSDIDESDWYYYNVLEATNAHTYDRREDGKLETWTAITENKVWVELDEMENAD